MPPPLQKFAATQGKHHVYLGCGLELPVVTWSPSAIEVRIPLGAQSGCVSVELAASDEDAALQRHAFTSSGSSTPLATRDAAPFLRASNGAKCAAQCVTGSDGGVINALDIGQLPTLDLSTMANSGPATELADGGLRLFVEGSGFLRWQAGDAGVRLRNTPRAGLGEELLTEPGLLRVSATNRCGTVGRSLTVSDQAALEYPRQHTLQPGGSSALAVLLPRPAEEDGVLRITAPPGVTAPKQVAVRRGQTSVNIELSLPRGQGAKALGQLTVSAPRGYGAPAVIPLTRAAAPRGFADVHVHQFANLGFGGVALVGRSDGSLASSLGECSRTHGPGGIADVVGSLVRIGVPGAQLWGHSTAGWADFEGWPDALDYSHQQVHHEALKRAWQGGLRLMVMLAINNKEACTSAPDLTGRKTTCEDMPTVWDQLDAARRFEANDGKGWYRIVTTAAQAREAITLGQLAVVLGAEVDTLGGCVSAKAVGKHCQPADVTQLVQELSDAGVRHIFPIHFVTSGFGGSALSDPLTHVAEGDTRRGCAAQGYEYNPAGVGGVCNPRGLEPLGRQLIQELISKKLIIDVDHQSRLAREAVLQLAIDANYPLVAGHASFFDLMKGYFKHEGVLLSSQLKQLRQLGGMVGILTNQTDRLEGMRQVISGPVRYGCGKSIEAWAQAYLYAIQTSPGPVAFGSDLNGFAGQPYGRGKTRGERRACLGGKASWWQLDPATTITYPFTSFTGVSFVRSVVGSRPYDFDTDGFAHVGMYPDFIEGLRKLGLSDAQLEPLLTSADGYVQMWERIDERP